MMSYVENSENWPQMEEELRGRGVGNDYSSDLVIGMRTNSKHQGYYQSPLFVWKYLSLFFTLILRKIDPVKKSTYKQLE